MTDDEIRRVAKDEARSEVGCLALFVMAGWFIFVAVSHKIQERLEKIERSLPTMEAKP